MEKKVGFPLNVPVVSAMVPNHLDFTDLDKSKTRGLGTK